jgi:hypothetical protein
MDDYNRGCGLNDFEIGKRGEEITDKEWCYYLKN